MDRGQFSVLAGAVKVILKRQKLTYLDLAARIGMSESGVKKLLTANDGSVNRLEAVCEALGITLLDLVQAAAEELPIQEVRFTLEVQEYLVAHPDCFHVFWKLLYEDMPVTELPEELGLTAAAVWKHVRQLDRLGLLTLEAGDRIVLPKRAHMVWVGDGPLVDMLRTRWAGTLLEQAVAGVGQANHHMGLRYLRLTESSRAELLQSVKDLIREFGDRSVRERLVQDRGDLVETRLMMLVAPGSFVPGASSGRGAARK
jgi:transcriptional regulator with XRE-family HTH domain